MMQLLDVGKRTLAIFGTLALLLTISGSFFSQTAVCGTCWNNPDASCIIEGILVEEACDAATPGCVPKGT